MATFGLIHGGGMGSWCWERLVPELGRRGHDTATVDLPADDDRAGLEAYTEAAVRAFANRDELILVGHSLGGLIVPLVAHRLEVLRMVFLCAMVPEVGRSVAQQLESDLGMVASEIAPGRDDERIEPTSAEQATALLYGDCLPEDALWALSRMRAQSHVPWREVSPLRTWPDCPATYILGRVDRCVMPGWGRRVALERLGGTAVELTSGHSPFVSQPAELADALDQLA